MDGLYAQVERRIDGSAALKPYRGIILYDWPEGDEHLEWALTASEEEIIAWAESIEEEEGEGAS